MAVTTNSIDLRWYDASDNVGVTGYKLYYADGTLITNLGLVNSYTDSGLLENTEYCYYHTALDAAGNESTPSNITCATTLSTIPTSTGFTFNVTVGAGDTLVLNDSYFDGTITYGDGIIDDYFGENVSLSHTYVSAGVYEVSITGFYTSIGFNDSSAHLLTDITQWGDVSATTYSFANTINFTGATAVDLPTFKPNTSLSYLFSNSSFNQDISSWDTKGVTDMSYAFAGSGTTFNQDITTLDFGAVTDMSYMFFNNLTYSLTLSGLGVGSVEDMSGMFVGSILTVNNYDALLLDWSLQTVQPNVKLDSDSQYTASVQAYRNLLTSIPNNWIITDGGVII